MLSVSRSNNVSIMLTQFADFAAGGPMALRAALLGRADLAVERLSLLLQARHCSCPTIMHARWFSWRKPDCNFRGTHDL